MAEPTGPEEREAQGLRLLHRTVTRFLALQAAAGAVVAVAWYLAAGERAAVSALVGGLIGVLPSAFYGWLLLRLRPRTAMDALRVQVVGEFGKLGLTLVLFALAFAGLRGVAALPLFCGFVATLVMYWAALFLFA